MSSSDSTPITAPEIALWGVLALLALSPGSVPLDQQPSFVSPSVSSYQPERITPQEVRARQAKGENMLIVDVRPEESYKLEHIMGAINSPWRDLDAGHGMLPKERLMLLYCT